MVRDLVETFVEYGAYPRGADNDYFEFNPMMFFPDPSAELRLDRAMVPSLRSVGLRRAKGEIEWAPNTVAPPVVGGLVD